MLASGGEDKWFWGMASRTRMARIWRGLAVAGLLAGWVLGLAVAGWPEVSVAAEGNQTAAVNNSATTAGSGSEAAMSCCGPDVLGASFPPDLSEYGDEGTALWASLKGRVGVVPFNLVATVIFGLAIVHTFLATGFQRRGRRAEEELGQWKMENGKWKTGRGWLKFRAGAWHVLGEVELVFGIWVIPLLVAMGVYLGWAVAGGYVAGLDFDEPVFVVVVMAMASTRPVVKLAEGVLRRIARLAGETPGAWWAAILTAGPLLGSLITEPAAMTISAMLLGQQFFALGPSLRLRFATLGLLFVNVSVGGTLTHFAAPPVLMVAGKWGWDSLYMLEHFGLQAVAGIVAANAVYWWVFRGEFQALGQAEKFKIENTKLKIEEATEGKNKVEAVPWGVTVAQVLFLAWAVMNLHHPLLLVGGFLIFLGFVKATAKYQAGVNLRGSVMVGLFLAGLVAHGGLQGWWIQPVLERLGELGLFFGAMFLTAFNDNAAITFLAALSPGVAAKAALQHAVMEGAVAGGGLTVIANAPNPAGQSLLGKHFARGISPLGLLAGAALPTAIVAGCFRLLGW